MIAVDSSALIAIMLNEAERASFLDILDNAPAIVMSAPSLVETRLVAWARGQESLVDQVMAYGIEIAPPGLPEADYAHAANVRYGKGRGHPAQLNFGDLFAYALARSRDIPLLFKGHDFTHTDIMSAV